MTTDANPVRPPSATPAALSMYVVFELTPPVRRRRPQAVHQQDTADAGTEPSSSASPASAATPVTVPIVSKKSVSMIEKIVRIAASGRAVKT